MSSNAHSFSDYRPRAWQRLVIRFAATGPGAWLFARLAYRADSFVLRLSRGRESMTGLLTNLPLIMVHCVGAKSGQPRPTLLLGIPDDERIILIASNFGNQRHPAWYYNLMANPDVWVEANGRKTRYSARQAQGAEKERLWNLAVELYAGYAAYKRRAGGREIPVIVLTPAPR